MDVWSLNLFPIDIGLILLLHSIKPCIFIIFQAKNKLWSPRLKQWSEQGIKHISLLCITLVTFPNPFRRITFAVTSHCGLCKGEVFLDDPSDTWRWKGAFGWDTYCKLGQTGLDEGLRAEAQVTVYLDWYSVAASHLISMVHTILLQPCGKGSSAFCLKVVIAICL